MSDLTVVNKGVSSIYTRCSIHDSAYPKVQSKVKYYSTNN